MCQINFYFLAQLEFVLFIYFWRGNIPPDTVHVQMHAAKALHILIGSCCLGMTIQMGKSALHSFQVCNSHLESEMIPKILN